MQHHELAAQLAALQQRHQYRQRVRLDSPQGVHVSLNGGETLSFASNDYLGLANHPALVDTAREAMLRWGVGAGASHLVTGHSAAHEEAEAVLADWIGTPEALLFGCGYLANQAVMTALLGRGDEVFADKLNHASLNDGALLSRARLRRFRHNDLAQLESLLQNSRARTRMIVVDAVYSMDGDEAPLPALLDLARRYDAWLFLDDAHGFGISGGGRGALTEYALHDPRVIYMATLGKAAGVSGAVVAGSRELCAWLVNRARAYIYTTASPPALAVTVSRAVGLIRDEAWRRERLAGHIARVQAASLPYPVLASRFAIQALMVGTNSATLALAERLARAGVWVPAIRPPTVPAGTARLRISLSAAHSEQDIEALLVALCRS
ncbi:8-amino-7-oxononanoate synthase [Craterilacuibacter sinensis]|uniref:8-amino-7-oxononanoate synthase n=1 Tax=Craterilacuibacter sinensis TaxID=2686017 RepID=A0A845BMC0_9NEIS|nr:8-amino-7-oxononanoate synthase [Craterilacuibacter sinensis]MXR36424.1 8-amino-7-oxononanoate synthase [Craterilacuibacter sinensis]